MEEDAAVSAAVTVTLCSAALDWLKNALEKQSGKVVLLEKREDPNLVGGLVTQLGDLVYDGSVRTQLAQLREELLAE